MYIGEILPGDLLYWNKSDKPVDLVIQGRANLFTITKPRKYNIHIYYVWNNNGVITE